VSARALYVTAPAPACAPRPAASGVGAQGASGSERCKRRRLVKGMASLTTLHRHCKACVHCLLSKLEKPGSAQSSAPTLRASTCRVSETRSARAAQWPTRRSSGRRWTTSAGWWSRRCWATPLRTSRPRSRTWPQRPSWCGRAGRQEEQGSLRSLGCRTPPVMCPCVRDVRVHTTCTRTSCTCMTCDDTARKLVCGACTSLHAPHASLRTMRLAKRTAFGQPKRYTELGASVETVVGMTGSIRRRHKRALLEDACSCPPVACARGSAASVQCQLMDARWNGAWCKIDRSATQGRARFGRAGRGRRPAAEHGSWDLAGGAGGAAGGLRRRGHEPGVQPGHGRAPPLPLPRPYAWAGRAGGEPRVCIAATPEHRGRAPL